MIRPVTQEDLDKNPSLGVEVGQDYDFPEEVAPETPAEVPAQPAPSEEAPAPETPAAE